MFLCCDGFTESVSLQHSAHSSLFLSFSLNFFSVQYVLYWHDNCYNVWPKHCVYIESRTDIYATKHACIYI